MWWVGPCWPTYFVSMNELPGIAHIITLLGMLPIYPQNLCLQGVFFRGEEFSLRAAEEELASTKWPQLCSGPWHQRSHWGRVWEGVKPPLAGGGGPRGLPQESFGIRYLFLQSRANMNTSRFCTFSYRNLVTEIVGLGRDRQTGRDSQKRTVIHVQSMTVRQTVLQTEYWVTNNT